MTTGISFKRGRRTPTLFKLLKERYTKGGLGENYITVKWEEWGKMRSLSILRAVRDNRIAGWILYDRKASTIEEVRVERQRSTRRNGRYPPGQGKSHCGHCP